MNRRANVLVNNKRRLSGSPQRQRKARVRELVRTRDLAQIESWVAEDRFVLRALAGLLFDREPLVCWRAIEALGRASAVVAEEDPERVRQQLRRQYWQMNDESGNVGWYAAEAIGEMLYNVPGLIFEYGTIMLSFLKEEPFEAGAHWAIARMACKKPEVFRFNSRVMVPSLKDADPHVRAFTLWALQAMRDTGAIEPARELLGDKAEISYYDMDSGAFKSEKVADAAKRYVELCEA